MERQEAVKATLSPQQLEHLWAEHLKGEFESKDVEATLATMVEDAYVNHMPVNTGGRGKDALRAFYRDDFIPSWPEDLQITPVNRVVGEGQLVDELHLTFTHSKPMPWLLPNVPPTEKKIADLVRLCMVMCKSPAKFASAPPMPKAKAMMPMCSIEE